MDAFQKTKSEIRNSRILVVDDETDIRETLASILKSEGFQAQCAADGREAVDLFTTDPFDLVITDIRMPDMNGEEVLKEVKRLDENVEVIVLTGYATMENAIRILKNDCAYTYLAKPLQDIEDLLTPVNRALEKRNLEIENRRQTAKLVEVNRHLEKSEARYRTLFAKMLNGFALHAIILDDAGQPCDYRFLEVNDAFERLTGLNSVDVVGKRALEVLPELEPSWIERYGRVALTGASERFEDYTSQLDRYYEVFAYCPEKGTFAAVFNDITSRRRTEESLKVSEREKAAVLNSMSEALVYQDMNNRILWANRAAGESTGLAPRRMAGRRCHEVFNPCNESCHECSVTKSHKSGAVEECVLEMSSGKMLFKRCYPVTDDGGGMIGAVVLGQDITEKRMMEAQLLKTRKLESIGVLAGGIAHDYNNLLSAFMGNISLARSELNPDDEVNEFLDAMERAALAAKDLTRKLITFSKGGTPMKRETPISPLLEDTVGFVLSGANIKSDFFIADALPPVEIDESQIGQAIQHLVVNAREAMPGGGTLVVGAEQAQLDEKNALGLKGGEYTKIWMRDNGAGIQEKNMERIFDPYFSTKEMGAQKGMGMGLAICHSILTSHGGGIIVKPNEGAGITVTMVLPASRVKGKTPGVKPAPPARQSSIAHPRSSTTRILLMDDEAIIRDITGQMLIRLGYDAAITKDGAEAISLYKKAMDAGKPFAVVILDLTVRGGMGGKETMRELLEIDPHVKGIVSSGYSADPAMAAFESHGFCGALAKAYNMRELGGMLQTTIGENPWN